ncbi:MAG TPA: class I SAM-dependent rRNA methyltransferase [Rubricoccaceae bacterium]|nr:class I SAM-dependent rRNA methyltransferase [Rubricoccaceae bacterium]
MTLSPADPIPRLVFKPGKDKQLRRGYPWVFANQVARVEGAPARGDVVEVASAAGEVYGQALYHDRSLIAGRFLTSDAERAVDEAFFRERVEQAVARRRAVYPDATHVRLVFGESDGLPGTVVDRYGPPGYSGGVLTFTTLSYGMEQRREWLLDALEDLLRPDAVVERNDVPLRTKDGLEERTGVLRGAYDGEVEIEESGVVFSVDVLAGPKTGFFIDQRENRAAVARFAAGRRVLDVFCADGGFGLLAARAGADHVHFLDVAPAALERVRANALRNGLEDRISTEAADALDRLGDLAAQREAGYDLVVLDPPGFAKSRRQVEAAVKAYQRINISALRLLPPGGLLATASCSQALSEDDFLKLLHYCARKAGVHLRRLYRGEQPPDHPSLEAMPETRYLKCYLFEVVGDALPGPL